MVHHNKGFFFENIYHLMPSISFNADGNRRIVHLACFGPIEIIEYGITINSLFYALHTCPEGSGEDDIKSYFAYVQKSTVLEAVDNEIETCKLYKNEIMLSAFIAEKEKLYRI